MGTKTLRIYLIVSIFFLCVTVIRSYFDPEYQFRDTFPSIYHEPLDYVKRNYKLESISWSLTLAGNIATVRFKKRTTKKINPENLKNELVDILKKNGWFITSKDITKEDPFFWDQFREHEKVELKYGGFILKEHDREDRFFSHRRTTGTCDYVTYYEFILHVDEKADVIVFYCAMGW